MSLPLRVARCTDVSVHIRIFRVCTDLCTDFLSKQQIFSLDHVHLVIAINHFLPYGYGYFIELISMYLQDIKLRDVKLALSLSFKLKSPTSDQHSAGYKPADE